MKKILFIIILSLLCAGELFSQDLKDVVETKSDKFSNRSGSLIQKEFNEVGKVSGNEITVLKIKDLNSNETISSVRFKNTSYSSTFGEEEYLNSIDKEELDGLIISVKKLIDEVIKTEPSVYSEVVYRSVSGFSLGAFYRNEAKKKGWVPFLKVDKYKSKSFSTLNDDNLIEILALLEKAKEMM